MTTNNTFKVPSVKEAFPDDWPDWVLNCLERLSDAENFEECSFFDGADEWVGNMLGESLKSMMPTIRWKSKDAQTGPEFLGALVGHQKHLLESDDVAKAMEKNLSKLEAGIEEYGVFLHEQFEENDLKKLIETLDEDSIPLFELVKFVNKETIDRKIPVLNECVSLAQEQPFAELKEFTSAYLRALETPLFDKNGGVKKKELTTEMYVILVVCWRKVQQMKVLRNVHEWLKKRLGYPKITNFERTRKTLNRRGLSLVPKDNQKDQDTDNPTS